jgi:membrane-bound serine protease (ClpP class)
VPWPESQLDWELFTNSVLGLLIGFLGFVVLAWNLGRYLPKLRFLSGLILIPTTAKQRGGMRVSMTAPSDKETAGVNIGDTGEVISTLRPAGKAKFDDCVVDVVAVAEFLDKGTKVEIIEIHGNRVVVRAAKS